MSHESAARFPKFLARFAQLPRAGHDPCTALVHGSTPRRRSQWPACYRTRHRFQNQSLRVVARSQSDHIFFGVAHI